MGTACAGGAAVGLGDLGFLSALLPVTAAEAALDPKTVRFTDDVEPLVRFFEDTPREKLIEEAAVRVRGGLSYRQVLAALLLAGVRNIQPRPSVGFKFHGVLVVNSAHLASLNGPPEDRWLPVFWALDYFKSAQARDEQEGNWTMPPVDEAAVPAPSQSRKTLTEAMDKWDESMADAAAAGLARGAGTHELFDLFFHYGCRDFRAIGHKAIYVANSYRTLQAIGPQYAEPVARSLAYALLNHVGEPNPAQSDLAPDRPWKLNQELAKALREDWLSGSTDEGATRRMLDVLRQATTEDACRSAVKAMNEGAGPRSVWDAVFAASAECVLRQPSIVSLHAVTTANALHHAFGVVAGDATRRLLLLQAVAFVTMFRDNMQRRGVVKDTRINGLRPEGEASLEAVFATHPADRPAAALGYLKAGGSGESLVNAARRLVFLKGDDPHDYKYSSAVLEDYRHVSPPWRDSFLAASAGLLNSHAQPDNALVQRIRQALG